MMTKQELLEVVQAVDNINADIDKCFPEGHNNFVLQYIDQSNAQCVVFLDDEIWNSEREDREWIEEYDEFKGDYEPIEPFLRSQIRKLIAEINKIKV